MPAFCYSYRLHNRGNDPQQSASSPWNKAGISSFWIFANTHSFADAFKGQNLGQRIPSISSSHWKARLRLLVTADHKVEFHARSIPILHRLQLGSYSVGSASVCFHTFLVLTATVGLINIVWSTLAPFLFAPGSISFWPSLVPDATQEHCFRRGAQHLIASHFVPLSKAIYDESVRWDSIIGSLREKDTNKSQCDMTTTAFCNILCCVRLAH